MMASLTHTPFKRIEPGMKWPIWESYTSVQDLPRLGEKNYFWAIWPGEFGWAAHDFGQVKIDLFLHLFAKRRGKPTILLGLTGWKYT